MYDEELLERSIHPEFMGKIDGIEPILLLNSSCGDELTVYLKVSRGKGKTIEEAREMSEEFSKMVIGEKYSVDKLGKARCLSCVSRMPARVKCAKLAWESLDKLA